MSKTAIDSFRYSGDIVGLKKAALTACERMGLKLKSETQTDAGLNIEAGEKMKWLTTNWPVSFNVSAEKVGDDWAVIVTGGARMVSITQDTNNQQKAMELCNLIKTLSPGKVS